MAGRPCTACLKLAVGVADKDVHTAGEGEAAISTLVPAPDWDLNMVGGVGARKGVCLALLVACCSWDRDLITAVERGVRAGG